MTSGTGIGISRRSLIRGSAAAASLVAVSGSLAACGGGSSGSAGGGDPDKLTYLSNDNDSQSVKWYDQINSAYQAGSGKQVEGQIVEPGQSFVTKLQSQIRAKQTPTFIPHVDETLAATLWASGLAKPADDIVKEIGESNFAPGALGHHRTSDGHYHSVPWTVNGMVYWYRTDLLEKAGLSAVNTWDDLLKFAKANTGGGTYGICLPFGQSTGATRVFFNFIANNGGHFVDRDLNVVFDSPENIETMTFLQELAQYTPPGSATFQWADMISKFTSKICASSFYPGRMLGDVVAKAPDIASKFAASLVPSPDGSNRLSYVKSEGPVLLTEDATEALAKDWIMNYQFSEKYYGSFLQLSGGNAVPQLTKIKTSADYTGYTLFQQHADIMKVLEQACTVGVNYSREAPDFPINSNGGQIDNGTAITEILHNLLLKKQKPATVAKNGAASIEKLMKGARKI